MTTARARDLAVGTLLLAASLPVQAAIAVAVRLDSRGPVLYRSVRSGRAGRLFVMYKFRTMAHGAGQRGPRITGRADPRVTRVGALLRRAKLDELPQLWNVVRGDMSLVGPRPEDPRFVALYDATQRGVLAVRPGLTGLSQLAYRDEQSLLPPDDPETAYVREIMPAKLALDLDYVRCRGWWLDACILGSTAALVLEESAAVLLARGWPRLPVRARRPRAPVGGELAASAAASGERQCPSR